MRGGVDRRRTYARKPKPKPRSETGRQVPQSQAKNQKYVVEKKMREDSFFVAFGDYKIRHFLHCTLYLYIVHGKG
jgi:hypothetical protein